MNALTDKEFSKLIDSVHNSHKYRDLGLPDAFLLDLINQNLSNSKNFSELKDNFRKSLHNVIAPYLEDIDYQAEIMNLESGLDDLSSEGALKNYCLKMMAKHASTRERIPHIQPFFDAIQAVIGEPESVLDLACALDPLCLPWIRLASKASFKAYDLNKPRIHYLQSFFNLAGIKAEAIQQDILLNPPPDQADCAFFLKEAHRLEKRQPGSTRILIENTKVRTFILSLPAFDLKGHHSLESYHRHLVEKAIEANNWGLESKLIGNEIIFFIHKEFKQ